MQPIVDHGEDVRVTTAPPRLAAQQDWRGLVSELGRCRQGQRMSCNIEGVPQRDVPICIYFGELDTRKCHRGGLGPRPVGDRVEDVRAVTVASRSAAQQKWRGVISEQGRHHRQGHGTRYSSMARAKVGRGGTTWSIGKRAAPS